MAFKSKGVLIRQIDELDLQTFAVGFDLDIFRYEALSELLMDTIVDFAFGFHTGIANSYDRRKLKEAAKSIYNIKEYKDVKWTYVDEDSELFDCELKAQDKYLKRGEFGELILHLLLRDFLKTTPLLSKIHFKDTDGAVVHGFDIVHIGKDPRDANKSTIFLGESKLYSRKNKKAGLHGVGDLVKDIEAHFKRDFLNREIALIGKKRYSYPNPEEVPTDGNKNEYENFLKDKDEWFDQLSKVESGESKLQDFLNSVTVPLVCTYQSELYTSHTDETSVEFIKEYEEEMRLLKAEFDKKLSALSSEIGEPSPTKLNVMLMLLPIPSKKELIKLLHQKLYNQQNA